MLYEQFTPAAHEDTRSLGLPGSCLASWDLCGVSSCQHPLVSHLCLLVTSTAVTAPSYYS